MRMVEIVRQRWRMLSASAGAIITVAALTAGLSLANSTSHASNNPGQAQPVATVAPPLHAALNVFSRPQQPGDIPPVDIVDKDVKAAGANPSLGRLAGAFGSQRVYIVPTSGGACLVSTSLLATGCFSSQEIIADTTGGTIACWPYMPADQQENFGLLVGARNVSATYNDGSKRPVDYNGDVYVLDAVPTAQPYPTTLSWDDTTGHHSRPTHLGPHPVPHPCTSASLSPDHSTPSQDLARARQRIGDGLQ